MRARVASTLIALFACSCGQATEANAQRCGVAPRCAVDLARAAGQAAMDEQTSEAEPELANAGQNFRVFAECVEAKVPNKLRPAAFGLGGSSIMLMTFGAAEATGCKLGSVPGWNIMEAAGIYAQVLFRKSVGDDAEAKLKASHPFTDRSEVMALSPGDDKNRRLFNLTMECAVKRDASAASQMMQNIHESPKQDDAISALKDDLSACANELGQPIPKLTPAVLRGSLETAAFRLVGHAEQNGMQN